LQFCLSLARSGEFKLGICALIQHLYINLI
jgi:hypothetical protein